MLRFCGSEALYPPSKLCVQVAWGTLAGFASACTAAPCRAWQAWEHWVVSRLIIHHCCPAELCIYYSSIVYYSLFFDLQLMFSSSLSVPEGSGCWGKEHCQGCHPTSRRCPLLPYICLFGSHFLSKPSIGRSSPGVAAWPRRQPPGCKRSSPGFWMFLLSNTFCVCEGAAGRLLC